MSSYASAPSTVYQSQNNSNDLNTSRVPPPPQGPPNIPTIHASQPNDTQRLVDQHNASSGSFNHSTQPEALSHADHRATFRNGLEQSSVVAPTTGPRFSPKTVQTVVNGMSFALTGLNFGMTVAFAVTLAVNAFTMPGITGVEVFHADRVLQSDGTDLPPNVIDAFVKKAFGVQSEALKTINSVTVMHDRVPIMYEINGGTSILHIEAVHCNFILFSALWTASSFALTMSHFPWSKYTYWSQTRVIVVHIWNIIGLILILVMFSATTKWSAIPHSNLLYSLVSQLMAWVYQYFYMVECTQTYVHNSSLKLNLNNEVGVTSSTHMRQLIYMEFSVVMPLLLIASMMPGAIGIDQWRVQSVFFASWTVFALLGLHLRFRKSLNTETLNQQAQSLAVGLTHPGRPGLDALGYLTYATIMAYIMLINAMGSNTFYDTPYSTASVTQSRWGARIIVLVTGILVVETLFKSISERVKSVTGSHGLYTKNTKLGVDVATGQQASHENESIVDAFLVKEDVEEHILVSFVGNMLIVLMGSFLVKVVVFAGLSNVNALSAWPAVL
jgi:hypothetical protein